MTVLNIDLNSPSFIIRRGILDRLKQVPTFQSVKRWGLTPALRVQAKLEDNQVPYVACYHVEETLSPDGDANHAEPRFLHTLRLGFSVCITCIDDNVADQNLDAAHWTIMNLLTNEYWAKFPAAGNWNLGRPIRIEAVTRGHVKKLFGNRMINNETPVAELQMELTVTHRTSFPPVIPDVLDTIHITVAADWPFDPNVNDPVLVEYDLPVEGEFNEMTGYQYALISPSFARPVLTVA